MVRLELERMAPNVKLLGSFGGGVQDMMESLSGITAQVWDMQEDMVTRAAYARLVDRFGQLEAGVGAAEVQAG